MNKWIELLIGLILVIVPLLLVFQAFPIGINERWDFLKAAWVVLKGGIFWFVVGIGFLFILLGISDLKS